MRVRVRVTVTVRLLTVALMRGDGSPTAERHSALMKTVTSGGNLLKCACKKTLVILLSIVKNQERIKRGSKEDQERIKRGSREDQKDQKPTLTLFLRMSPLRDLVASSSTVIFVKT